MAFGTAFYLDPIQDHSLRSYWKQQHWLIGYVPHG